MGLMVQNNGIFRPSQESLVEIMVFRSGMVWGNKPSTFDKRTDKVLHIESARNAWIQILAMRRHRRTFLPERYCRFYITHFT